MIRAPRPDRPGQYLAALIVVLGLGGAAALPAAAQTPPAPPAAAPRQAPDPNAINWSSTANVALGFQHGTADTVSVTLLGEVLAASARRSYTLQGDHTYLKVEGPGYSQVQAHNDHLRFSYRQNFAPHMYFIAHAAYRRDEVQRVDYHFEQLAGVGFWRGNAAGRLDVIPVFGFTQQEKNVPGLDRHSPAAGVFQQAIARLGQQWSLTQSFLYLHDFDGANDYRMQMRANLAGKITGPLGLSVAYRADHENIVIAGSDSTNQGLSVGLQFQFPARP